MAVRGGHHQRLLEVGGRGSCARKIGGIVEIADGILSCGNCGSML